MTGIMSYGLIYDSSQNKSSGTVWLNLPESSICPKSSHKRILLPWLNQYSHTRSGLSWLASFLFLIGSAGILLTMLPVAAVNLQYNFHNSYNNYKSYIAEPTPEPGPANDWEAFSIRIPKINIQSIIVPNIDAGNPQIYGPALKKGIAHALGSGLPGMNSDINRTIYLFAHSTSAPAFVKQLNAQFYLLNKLEIGDEIDITFYAKDYRYRVREIKTVPAADTSVLEPQTKEELLVLSTCTPPGTTWNRLLVIAERI